VTPAAYEPLVGRAKWAQRALIALVVLNAIGVVSALFAYQLYGNDLITQDDLDRTDLREGLVAVLTFVAFLFAIVFFIRWFRRAYRNLPALGATGLRYRSGWTIGSWFIPIAGLIIPKQIANDIWRASNPREPANQGTLWQGGRVPDLYQWWWGFFVVGSFLGNAAFRADLAANDIDGYRRAAVVTIASDLVDVVGATLAVLVIRRTTDRLEARAAVLAASAESPPPV
jgi:heme/copper-type cytochrome/quinol oxidase subunit 2